MWDRITILPQCRGWTNGYIDNSVVALSVALGTCMAVAFLPPRHHARGDKPELLARALSVQCPAGPAARPTECLSPRSQLLRVLDHQRPRLRPRPVEEPVGLFSVIQHDEQSRACRAEPAESRVCGPYARLVVVLHE